MLSINKKLIKCRDFSFCEKDLLFLYEILKQRPRIDPNFKLPSYDEHVKYMSNFKENYLRWLIVSYNEIDYGICYMSKKMELSLLTHVDLDLINKNRKTINMEIKRFLYEKVKYLIEGLNLREFYAKSHKTNKIGINSLINFHKKYIKDYYKIQTFNGEDVVNFIFKKI
jgi:hypothetical protein